MISYYALGASFNQDNRNLILSRNAPENLGSNLPLFKTLQEKISLPCSALQESPLDELPPPS